MDFHGNKRLQWVQRFFFLINILWAGEENKPDGGLAPKPGKKKWVEWF
jgi:hypothetical protein